jgi:FixJ family two-component response regulator
MTTGISELAGEPAPAARSETETKQAHARPSIALVDDDASVLRSLSRVLSVHGFRVTAYASPKKLLDEIGALRPDCVIADLAMPEITGLDLQAALSASEATYPIVFLTGFGDLRTSVRAMRGGAIDFLAKPVEPSELLEAVKRALEMSRASREASDGLRSFRERLASLTQRERDVFNLVVAGQLNKQIAGALGIAEKTVKVHRARVMRKMAVKSVAGLARVAERMGVTPPLR